MNQKVFGSVVAACIVAMAAGYLLFLAASWYQMSQEHAHREAHMNNLLDRMPKPDASNSDSSHIGD